MKKLREFFFRGKRSFDSTHGMMLAMAGAYIVWLGISMLKDSRSGASSMPVSTSIIFMSFMLAAGAIIVAYGLMMCYFSYIGHNSKKETNMKIYSILDPEFRQYGKVLAGYDTAELTEAMNKIKMPENNVDYEPSIKELEECGIFDALKNRAYGGLPIQLGMCWGYNTKLNCLEYHRSSEINIGSTEYVLLLAKQQDIINGTLDTSTVKAFRAPAGAVVEVYATSLHYAPCQTVANGFRTAVVLPKGTNTEKPVFDPENDEDRWMTANNKWLLAHKESAEGSGGAYIGLSGKNIDIG